MSIALESTAVHSLAIASGKGGVGKSFLAMNLAWCLGELGQRVLLVELDADAGGLSIAAGLGEPPVTRPARDVQELAHRVVTVPGTTHVHLLRASDLAPQWMRTPSALESVLASVGAPLRIQWRIFDLAPGLSGPAVMWFGRVERAILIGTPELVSVQAMLRFHKQAKYQHAYEYLLRAEPGLRDCGPSLKAAREKLFSLRDATGAQQCWDRALRSFHAPQWVFNRCLTDDAAQLTRIRSYLANHVAEGASLTAEMIPEDEAQLRCARYGRILLRYESESPAARAIRRIGDTLVAAEASASERVTHRLQPHMAMAG